MKWSHVRILIIYGCLLLLIYLPASDLIKYYFFYLPKQRSIAVEVAKDWAEREGYDYQNSIIKCKRRDNLYVVRFSPKDPATFGGGFEVGLDARSKEVKYHYWDL